jgi:hypothetical protein
MIHFIIPFAILVAIKGYFLAHGLSIGMAAIKAGYRAHRNGEDVVDAAIRAGATSAAADLLRDGLRRLC